MRKHLCIREDEGTALLRRRLRVARRRGYLTHAEFVAACRWKSPRAVHHFRANSHHRIRAATRAALSARDERVRLEALMKLDGVSVPMASAILTLLDPAGYGVLDIRVWQLLHATGAVTDNERGTHFRAKHWLQFLDILRQLSRRLGVTARKVERALFDAHKDRQVGRLYDRASHR